MSDDVWLESQPDPPAPAEARRAAALWAGWEWVCLALAALALALALGWRQLRPAGHTQPAAAAQTITLTVSELTPAALSPAVAANPLLPDLRVLAARLEPEVVGACQGSPAPLGVRVWLQNAGVMPAGPFAVSINGAAQMVPGLGPGDVLAIWQPGEVHEAMVQADVLGQVTETDKTNDRAIFPLASPTELAPCPATPLPAAAFPSATPAPQASPTPTAPVCAGALPEQLRLGQRARVSRMPSLSVRLRREPNLQSDIIGLARPGEQIKLIDGPECADGMVWWKVIPASTERMVMGWAAEGDANGYWLVPETGNVELLPPFTHSAGGETGPASLPSASPAVAVAAAPPPVATALPAPSVTPTGTPLPAANRLAANPANYVLETGSPQYMADFAHTAGCSWHGVVGQVLDEGRRPVLGLTVSLDGGGLHLLATTGSRPEYGPAGFELSLGGSPPAATQTYTIQLYSPAGQPLSALVSLATYADCNRNMAVVIFVPAGP